jgi:predicted nucleotidyltransferase
MRTLQQDKVNTLRQILKQAVEETGLQMIAVYLHGSFGTPYMRDDSDIDLAFLAERPLTFKDSSAFSIALETAWHGGNFDIADLRRCDTVFLAQVVTSGERIYTGDELAARRFEMTALSKYARLNEERAGIIADIKQRGKVYGSEAQPR